MLKFEEIDNLYPDSLPEFILRGVSSFERRYGVHLTVHAQNDRWYDSGGNFLFRKLDMHRAEHCRLKRYSSVSTDHNCLHDCGTLVEKECQRTGKPFRFSCWKGCRELIVPFVHDSNLELIFYIGTFRGELPAGRKWHRSCRSLPEYPQSDEAELIFAAQALGMSFYLRLQQEKQPRTGPVNRREAIREYILRHGCGEITLHGLGKFVGLSDSRISHECVSLLGVSFQNLVLNARMNRAAHLLQESDTPIKDIAQECGFSGVCYFSRSFRSYFHDTPARYRKRMQEQSRTSALK